MSPRLLAGRAPALLLDPIVRVLAVAGVSPAMVTTAGLIGNVIAAVLIGRGELVAGGIVMLVASGLDMFDGALARATGRATPFGAVLDATFDRISEAAVLFGVLVHQLDLGNREEALLVFAALTGSLLVSYVRAKVEATGGVMSDGLFTRTERIVVTSVALITGWLRAGLWVLAVLTLLTAAQRLLMAPRALREVKP
ncbi:MAG TPA: CDP-alcohol phosphatidyltransferase family protein [Dehalococcoidia bacterium]|nr:CDP-alcohol phosphatidyltransferase family protein [Dehalococcoidia bacterium]